MSTLALCAALAACGGGDAPAATAAPLVAPGAWVVLGSSTAAGVGAPDGQGWVALLAGEVRPLGVTLTNLARSGLQSSQALPSGSPLPAGRPAPDPEVNIDRALAASPNMVVLAFPSNDAVAGVPAAETVAAWRSIQAQARAAGAVTLVLSTQPRAGLTPAQQATLEGIDDEAAAHFGPCFVALRETLSGPAGGPAAGYSAGDGVHLNGAGHRLVFERVTAVLAGGRCVRLSPAR